MPISPSMGNSESGRSRARFVQVALFVLLVAIPVVGWVLWVASSGFSNPPGFFPLVLVAGLGSIAAVCGAVVWRNQILLDVASMAVFVCVLGMFLNGVSILSDASSPAMSGRAVLVATSASYCLSAIVFMALVWWAWVLRNRDRDEIVGRVPLKEREPHGR